LTSILHPFPLPPCSPPPPVFVKAYRKAFADLSSPSPAPLFLVGKIRRFLFFSSEVSSSGIFSFPPSSLSKEGTSLCFMPGWAGKGLRFLLFFFSCPVHLGRVPPPPHRFFRFLPDLVITDVRTSFTPNPFFRSPLVRAAEPSFVLSSPSAN